MIMRKPPLDSLPAISFWSHMESKRTHLFVGNFVSQSNTFTLKVFQYSLIFSLLILNNIEESLLLFPLNGIPSWSITSYLRKSKTPSQISYIELNGYDLLNANRP